MKPLFIPLKSEYYEAFANGTKDTEYRPDGPRWNMMTCKPGRSVVISKGYGKNNRLAGIVDSVDSRHVERLPHKVRNAMYKIYGPAAFSVRVICIRIRDIRPMVQP